MGHVERILVVDDEPAIADLLVMTLVHSGFTVEAVGTACAARESIHRSVPSLVLMDVGLPDESGFAAMRTLKDEGVRVPVIFVTARDSVEDRISGLSVGAQDYVVKPFSIEDLLARVTAVLERNASAPTAHTTLAA